MSEQKRLKIILLVKILLVLMNKVSSFLGDFQNLCKIALEWETAMVTPIGFSNVYIRFRLCYNLKESHDVKSDREHGYWHFDHKFCVFIVFAQKIALYCVVTIEWYETNFWALLNILIIYTPILKSSVERICVYLIFFGCRVSLLVDSTWPL